MNSRSSCLCFQNAGVTGHATVPRVRGARCRAQGPHLSLFTHDLGTFFFLLFVSSVNLGSFLYSDISSLLPLSDMFTTAFSSPAWNQGCWQRYGFSSGLVKLLVCSNKSLYYCSPCVLVPFCRPLGAPWACAALKFCVLAAPNLSSIFSSCFASLRKRSFVANSTHHEAISCPSKCRPSPTFLQFSRVCWT